MAEAQDNPATMKGCNRQNTDPPAPAATTQHIPTTQTEISYLCPVPGSSAQVQIMV